MVYIIVAVAIIAVISTIIKVNRYRSEKKEIAGKAEHKMREEALDRAILNKDYVGGNNNVSAAVPYEVDYRSEPAGQGSDAGHTAGKGMTLQIIENSELSSKKYVFDPNKIIRIGTLEGKNQIVIRELGLPPIQCEIKRADNKIYIRSLESPGAVHLERKKKELEIREGPIEIKTGDCIIIGKTKLELRILKMGKGV
ncbi:MAG: hypothetical protein IK078_07285 [Lachnospiraceae bacterium]|nr:hypothetical protein [Lachnospiraceae bacterium]